ncbi:MAG: adenosylcobinamide-GDP ribazoletransferase [Spirochaetaceae bacterium]|nr:adenosylcobinamide-GDP ribazoletransferase [Spirochaetaceae bacterium]
MNGLRAALTFLTILPAGAGGTRPLAAAPAWFPAVGLLLGAMIAALDLLLAAAGLRPAASACDPARAAGCAVLPLLAAALLISALAVLTRALHLDGFMDTCDALPGGFSRARRLQILRDPHVGAFAVVGVACLLLIKVTAVAALPRAVRPGVLLLFPCLSRWAMLLAMEIFPYVRERGAGTPFAGARGRGALIGGSAAAVVAGLAVAGWWSLALLALAGAAAAAVGMTARRLLGGMTGDIYGAVNEIAEVAVLVAAVAVTAGGAGAMRSPLAGWFEGGG